MPPIGDSREICSTSNGTAEPHGEGRNYHFLIDEFFRVIQCLPWLKDLFAREKPFGSPAQ